jgi:hypothetical protein
MTRQKRFSWTGAVCTCQLEFTTENDIDHTPKDETIGLYAGNAFDMTGERSRTEYRPDFNARWLTCQDKSYRKKPNVLRKRFWTRAIREGRVDRTLARRFLAKLRVANSRPTQSIFTMAAHSSGERPARLASA